MRTMSERSRRFSTWQFFANRQRSPPVDSTSLRGYCYDDQPARQQPLIVGHIFESPRQPPQFLLRRPSGLHWPLLRDRSLGSRPALPTQAEIEPPALRSRILSRPLRRAKTDSGHQHRPKISAPLAYSFHESTLKREPSQFSDEIDKDEIKTHRGPNEAIFTLRQHPNPQAEISVAYSYPSRSTSLRVQTNRAVASRSVIRRSRSSGAVSNITAPSTTNTLRNLAEVDPDKNDNAFARIHPAGWNQILPKQWIDDSPDHSDCANTGTTRSLYSHDDAEAQDVDSQASSATAGMRPSPTQSPPKQSSAQFVSRLAKTVNPRYKFEGDEEQDLETVPTQPNPESVYTEVFKTITKPQSLSESQIAQNDECWWDDDVGHLAVNARPSHNHSISSSTPKVAQTSHSADEMYEIRLEQPHEPCDPMERPSFPCGPVSSESRLVGPPCDATSGIGPALHSQGSFTLPKHTAAETSPRGGEREAVDEWFQIDERTGLFALPTVDCPIEPEARRYQTTTYPMQATPIPFVVRRRPLPAFERTVMVPGRIYQQIVQRQQEPPRRPLLVPQQTFPSVSTTSRNPTRVRLEDQSSGSTSRNVDQRRNHELDQQYETDSPRELDDRYFESQAQTQRIHGHIDHLIDMYLPEIPEEGSGDSGDLSQKPGSNDSQDDGGLAGLFDQSEHSPPRAADEKPSPHVCGVGREDWQRTNGLPRQLSRPTRRRANTTGGLEHVQNGVPNGVSFPDISRPQLLRRQALLLSGHPINPGRGRSNGNSRDIQGPVAPTTYLDEHGNTWI
ncbi:hypothetical protein B0A52_00098 [Exophiala mesophila]|uniref:Uncharacterized protein n=1 Tax=Exophiala mesophila TaxID=212818 RepID=A0A438NJ61_EXOME|nr:hypothetical protein B0A52_00098 [Exophiala mesophila]